ncbi:hypothetical protein GCM10023185_43770 [Hymenobacter saemangeumensis]|uniref:Uncharacterized protein n=1 Tax=Hymenobacter saemangeumensis TaxID=1084522 RepID=A0ABP8ISI7_9BACT
MFDFSRTVFFFALFAAISWPIQLWAVIRAKKKAKYAVETGSRNTFGFYSKFIVPIVVLISFSTLATLNGYLGSNNGFVAIAVNCVWVLWPSLIAIAVMKLHALVKNQTSKSP